MLGVWNLSTLKYQYIRYIKFSEKGTASNPSKISFPILIFFFKTKKGIETSPDGKYVAIARKEKGKDCISTYHSGSFRLLEVKSRERKKINIWHSSYVCRTLRWAHRIYKVLNGRQMVCL